MELGPYSAIPLQEVGFSAVEKLRAQSCADAGTSTASDAGTGGRGPAISGGLSQGLRPLFQLSGTRRASRRPADRVFFDGVRPGGMHADLWRWTRRPFR